jgi:hypothetical protein
MSEHSSTKIAAPQQTSTATHSRPVSKPSITPARSALLQRACACGELPGAGGKCDACDKKNKKNTLQRASNGGAQPASVPPSVNQVLSSPGRPLDNSTRSFMESRFGHDFGSVRIHDDPLAAESARAVNASAYTIGQHIAFADGQYQPSSPAGAALLAHELTHTVQQEGLQHSPAGTSPVISSENDSSEQEAASVAAAVMRGDNVALPSRSSSPVLHRTPWGNCPAGTKKTLNEDFAKELKKKKVAGGAKPAKEKAAKYFTWEAAVAAEDHIAAYFMRERSPHAQTNKSRLPLKKVDPHTDPVQHMINETYEYLRSAKRKKPATPGKAAKNKHTRPIMISVPPSSFAEGDLEEVAGAQGQEPEGRKLEPDFVDFKRSEVYDATTIDAASTKVDKIKEYIDKFERIRLDAVGGPIDVPKWSAGTTLSAPSRFTYGLQNASDPIKVCFGVTDFELYPGVLAYQIIDTSGATGGDMAEGTSSETEPYEIKEGALQATLQVPKGAVGKKGDTVPIPESDPAARMLPGVTLAKLNRKATGDDIIDAAIVASGDANAKEPKALPIEIQGNKDVLQFSVNKKTRELTQKKAKKTSIPFEYKPLSMGAITDISFNETKGLSGKGYIKPSIPLLKGVKLDLEFAENKMSVISAIPKESLKSLPGFTVTGASLAIELSPFKPSGKITFHVGPKNKPFADGVIEVSADEQGFYAKGDINTHIPGVDEAPIEIIYRPASGWSGSVSITTSAIPLVQNANVTITFSDQGMGVSGGLKIELPRDQSVELKVQKKKGTTAWIYTGDGAFKVPGLKTVVIHFTYDGKKVSGDAKTGFTYQGIEGDIDLVYENGAVTGTGKVEIEKPKGKPKVKGTIAVTLHKNGNLTGEGKVDYEIKPGLIASAGIKVDEKGKVTLVGSLTFPPYQLFKKFPDPPKRLTIFEIPTITIPIPGASIGPIGLKAKIDAGIYANFSVGPGEIQGGYIKTIMNPLEDNPNLDIELGGKVYIPASFSVTGSVTGSVALDVGVASVAGGLTLSVTASLDGHVLSNLKAHYFQGKFEAEADFELLLALAFYLALSAIVKAEAGVWRFKVTTTKEWELAKFKLDTALKLGLKLKKPLAYSSEKGFSAPSFDDIEWILPKFEPEEAVKESFARDKGKENPPPA